MKEWKDKFYVDIIKNERNSNGTEIKFLAVEDMEKEELRYYFPEFQPYEGQCRFQGCTHTHEPGCAVKEALEQEKIGKQRYGNYLEMYRELEEKRRY